MPLIRITSLYDHIYSWFLYLREHDLKMTGYVLMPNHVHLLIYYPKSPKPINSFIANGKRFMAYEIVKRLTRNNQQVLKTLENAVTEKEGKDGKLHRVFNPSFDIKICRNRRFVEQKLDYIHFNPVRGKWNLVDDYVDYDHSSARYYELGQESELPITHYMDLI